MDELAERRKRGFEKKILAFENQLQELHRDIRKVQEGNQEIRFLLNRLRLRVVGEGLTPPPDRSDCD